MEENVSGLDALYAQRGRILNKLLETEPGTDAYTALMESIAQVNTEIISLEESDRRQTGLAHQMEMEEESLRLDRETAASEAKTSKWDVALRFGAALLGGVIAGLFGLAGIERTVQLEESDIPSRNGYGLAKSLFPRK